MRTQAATALHVDNVTKTFGPTRALSRVSFKVQRGSVHALLGGNGSGKSTLIKILAGVLQGDPGGSISVGGHRIKTEDTNPKFAKEAGLHFLHQSVGMFPDMTVAENFALGALGGNALRPINWRALHRQVAATLEMLEIDVEPTMLVRRLRPSTQTMIAVARALHGEDQPGQSVLVLDEPTATLPSEEVETLLTAIRGYARRGHSVVFVSHRLDEVLELCSDVTILRDGQHQLTQSLAGTSRGQLIELLTGAAHTPVHDTLPQAVDPASSPRIAIKAIQTKVLKSASLSVMPGEIVGIAGLTGSGRTSLLRAVYGDLPVDAGHIELDGSKLAITHLTDALRQGIAYVPEDRHGQGIFPGLSIVDNFSLPRTNRMRGLRIKRVQERLEAQSSVEKYGVVVPNIDGAISTLSGGNQQKVVVGRALDLQPAVLLLDEPSQGVDVAARAAIHRLIVRAARDGCAVIVVSSDPDELSELCDRVVGLVRGQVVGEVSAPFITTEACVALSLAEPTEPSAAKNEMESLT